MSGLILKDILNSKKYLKQYALIILAFFIWSWFSKSSVMIVTMLGIFGPNIFLGTIAYDETAKWDRYVATMPVSKRDVIKAKYLLFGAIFLISLVLMVGTNLVFFRFVNQSTGLLEENALESMAMGLGILVIINLSFAITIPLNYKFGVERGRIFIIFILLGMSGIFTFVVLKVSKISKMKELMTGVIQKAVNMQWLVYTILILFVGIFVFISYLVSAKIYEKKEY